mmetsp:Transcript_37486/g.96948  ORF Transcript_37486/g.96948 Transcript_37486/m.96948 type:complete len:96 (+) Transcript_37486:571-858(+)
MGVGDGGVGVGDSVVVGVGAWDGVVVRVNVMGGVGDVVIGAPSPPPNRMSAQFANSSPHPAVCTFSVEAELVHVVPQNDPHQSRLAQPASSILSK